jgi:hypothetical protein
MLPLAGLSRRALVAVAAPAAVAPPASASKRKQAPLATVAITVSGLVNNGTSFDWSLLTRVQHLEFGAIDRNTITTPVADMTEQQARASIEREAIAVAEIALRTANHLVPIDRIAVVML